MKLTAIILAGGSSSRMGEDKGLMDYKGKPMIQWVIEAVQSLVDEIILITGNSDYKQFGYELVADEVSGKGPLMGICSGLKRSGSQLNVVLSCDTPNVTVKLLQHLVDHTTNAQVTIPKHLGRTHQLMAVIDKSSEETFRKCIDNNELKLLIAYENLNLNIVNTDQFDSTIFKNINTKDELEA